MNDQAQALAEQVVITHSTVVVLKHPSYVGQVRQAYLDIDGSCVTWSEVQSRFPDTERITNRFEKPRTMHAWYAARRGWGSLIFWYRVEKPSAIVDPQMCLDKVEFDFSQSS